MANLFLWSSTQIIRQALGELRETWLSSRHRQMGALGRLGLIVAMVITTLPAVAQQDPQPGWGHGQGQRMIRRSTA